MADRLDVAVIGGGIVGLATARAIRARRPDLSLVVLEKERAVGTHQTGHNSGVVHSGVYYRPGSLKARLTLEGRASLLAFAEKNGVTTRTIGKLIVAVKPRELPALDELLSGPGERCRVGPTPDPRRAGGPTARGRRARGTSHTFGGNHRLPGPCLSPG